MKLGGGANGKDQIRPRLVALRLIGALQFAHAHVPIGIVV